MQKQLKNIEDKYISHSLSKNLAFFNALFIKDAVLRVRKTELLSGAECAVLFMDGMINNEILGECVLRPMLKCRSELRGDELRDVLQKSILSVGEVKDEGCVAELLRAVLYGDSVILIDESSKALIINTKGWRTRGISEPNDERVLQGPREGFDEALMLNLAQLRRKLPTPDLCVESLTSGTKTDTKIFLCYLESVADIGVVNEIKRRVRKIDIDGVLDVNYISEQIRPHRHSLFKTTGTTERPDIVAARLLEGRVALMVDGTPVVLTAPYLFCENFQSDDDYYLNYTFAAIGRILRYICFFLSVSVPAVFLSLIAYHSYLLPTPLCISIAESRGGVPFPSYIEGFLLILIFEILRETGIRMQQSVGHALSIVGGLVVGQAAVEAKLISAPMLIAVSLSCICGLTIPRLKSAVFYLRLFLFALSVLFGLFGYLAGSVFILVRIFSLSSFGTDYTETLRRFSKQSLKDTVIRAPWWKMITRPYGLTKNVIRQKNGGKN